MLGKPVTCTPAIRGNPSNRHCMQDIVCEALGIVGLSTVALTALHCMGRGTLQTSGRPPRFDANVPGTISLQHEPQIRPKRYRGGMQRHAASFHQSLPVLLRACTCCMICHVVVVSLCRAACLWWLLARWVSQGGSCLAAVSVGEFAHGLQSLQGSQAKRSGVD